MVQAHRRYRTYLSEIHRRARLFLLLGQHRPQEEPQSQAHSLLPLSGNVGRDAQAARNISAKVNFSPKKYLPFPKSKYLFSNFPKKNFNFSSEAFLVLVFWIHQCI